MVKRTVREIIFFLLIFLLFFITVNIQKYWMSHMRSNHQEGVYIAVGAVYTLLIVAVYYLANLNSTNEGFWQVTPAARCRGGPYMWQGDSEMAKTCRKLSETKNGRNEIANYNCPTGFVGIPKRPFVYSPLSDDNWKNARDCPKY